MKLYDKFLNLGGKECVVSDEIKLDKSTLDLDHMINEGDIIRIPLRLKLNDLENYFDVVEHTNESADLGWENECWCDDYDEEKSFISLFIDLEALSCGDGGLQVVVNVIPPYRTQAEIDEEVQDEKVYEEKNHWKPEIACEGCEPVYYWEQLRDRLMDEKQWLENHSDKEGHYSFYQVDATQEALDKILSIPEIKKAYDAFNNAFHTREDA